MTKTTVYISGPISGIDNYAEIFAEAEKRLTENNYDVINPVSLTHNHDKTYQAYMRADTRALLECDKIYMLPGWEKSKGAKFEHQVAMMCGIDETDGGITEC